MGWRASDLDDPAVERAWFDGRFEILQGVLTVMPPAYFTGGNVTANLVALLKAHAKSLGSGDRVAVEADIIIDEERVIIADAVLLSPDDQRRQETAARAAQAQDLRRTRILVPPKLVLESISPGHEKHDRETKRRWYAEFGVPNYWIVDAFAETLECLRLDAGVYVTDAAGTGDAVLQPPAFPGLTIPLREIWND
jgi:Uma2 family endonuclease